MRLLKVVCSFNAQEKCFTMNANGSWRVRQNSSSSLFCQSIRNYFYTVLQLIHEFVAFYMKWSWCFLIFDLSHFFLYFQGKSCWWVLRNVCWGNNIFEILEASFNEHILKQVFVVLLFQKRLKATVERREHNTSIALPDVFWVVWLMMMGRQFVADFKNRLKALQTHSTNEPTFNCRWCLNDCAIATGKNFQTIEVKYLTLHWLTSENALIKGFRKRISNQFNLIYDLAWNYSPEKWILYYAHNESETVYFKPPASVV